MKHKHQYSLNDACLFRFISFLIRDVFSNILIYTNRVFSLKFIIELLLGNSAQSFDLLTSLGIEFVEYEPHILLDDGEESDHRHERR